MSDFLQLFHFNHLLGLRLHLYTENASCMDLNWDFRVSQLQHSQENNRKETVSKVTFLLFLEK